ncbi:glycosyl hydrolase family 28-related protein [Acetobacterium bakii]|uniref:Uncharacterized protein n=1 Tax=Acetobacterium bakii TaxID=52689 RepID=A0A0L6TYT7_9FIRM|nr:glycosyl hydrolase family 28-related protein [Acetobacterium bakii]KNZ41403.1 hypothetical protein AKG39_12360 [Acetobacterium bakii]
MTTVFIIIGTIGLILFLGILIVFRIMKKPLKIPAIFLAGFSVLMIIGYIAFQTLLPALGIIDNNSSDIPVINEPTYNAGANNTPSFENPGMATNIIELGGLGDGVFDNTAVIQTAEDNGVDIYFPDGVYRINGYILKKNSSWYGQSKFGTIFLYDDEFNYALPSILEDPEASGNGGSPFLRTEFSDDQFITSDDYNSFVMQDFTLKWRVTTDYLEPLGGKADLWYVGNCKDIILRNLCFDSDDASVVGTAFFTTIGAVDGLLIEGCTFIQDSNPLMGEYHGYGGPLCLQNFTRTRGSSNFIIRNNHFVKKHGADELIWISAGSNFIDGIYILNNTFEVTSNEPEMGFQSTAIRIRSSSTTGYSTPGKSYVDNIHIMNNTITGGTFAYSVVTINESEDNSMPPINYVNVSNNVINATTNFNVEDYETWACALSLNGTGTVYSIAENNTIAGNFEAGIDGFKIVRNNQLDLTDCRQGIRGAQIALGNVVNISGIGVTGID